MPKEFSIFEAANIIGRVHTTLREWLKGYIPLYKEQLATGYGTKTILYIDDLYRIKTFEMLLNMEIRREFAAAYIEYLHPSNELRPKDFNWENYFFLYKKSIDGHHEMALFSQREFKQYSKRRAELKKQFGFLIELIINLNEVKKVVDKKVAEKSSG